MERIEWRSEQAADVAETMRTSKARSNNELYIELKRTCKPTISIKGLRAIAARYSKKAKVPIRISARAVEAAYDDADAMYSYHYNAHGKVVGVIYLHPILIYYPVSYIKAVIEHELDHMGVEQRWSEIF